MIFLSSCQRTHTINLVNTHCAFKILKSCRPISLDDIAASANAAVGRYQQNLGRAVEFANIRPGGAGQASEAELLALPRDDADEAVYAAARARFERDTRAYGATPSACRERCPGVEFSHSR